MCTIYRVPVLYTFLFSKVKDLQLFQIRGTVCPIQGVFYTIPFLGSLSVIPMIHGTYQIAGNSADAFKWHMGEFIVQIRVLSV